MNKRVTLAELHNALLRLSIKDDNVIQRMSLLERGAYVAKHFPEQEYSRDNWYKTSVSLVGLVSSNTEFRRELSFNKDEAYVLQWQSIKEQLVAIKFVERWLIPRDIFIKETYIPIITREYRAGSYWVWDGQRRTLSALWHGLEGINAYVSPTP